MGVSTPAEAGGEWDTLTGAASAWAEQDPDPQTRAELAGLVAAGDLEELRDRFRGPLRFGTAGLRGAMGAGPNRMNRAVVICAAAGLADYLKTNGVFGVSSPTSVVVGWDARHRSRTFALDTAAVMRAAGLRTLLLPRPLPTPVLAFAVRELGCAAGVMVTASHNPAADNGYKVYLGDGSQIVPPADEEIADRIARVAGPSSVPRADSGWEVLDEDLVRAYLDRAAAVVGERPVPGARDLRVVYTAMHGVGGAVLPAAFERAGFAPVVPVVAQADPDPDFPTVAYPNPEEPGALDLAFATAGQADADLVIAHDPDADRCAVAVPDRDGRWRMLRGDETGVLLGVDVAAQLGARGRASAAASGDEHGGVLATTVVSSSLLGEIADRYGLGYRETLTGFKWLARVPALAFGYEEALGYCVDPGAVRDKDGVSAALRIAAMAARAKASGRTLIDLLGDLAHEYGLHATDQYSVRVERLSDIDDMMATLRANPPRSLGGLPVRAVDDLSTGTDDLPPTDAVRYRVDGADGVRRARVVVRPSGTEPKLKAYLEVVVEVGTDLVAADAVAAQALTALRADVAAALGR